MKAYLDNGATTPVDPAVLKAMMPYFSEKFGNASSSHSEGEQAKIALEESRESIAKTLGARHDEIVFTSGGTESNNFAIKGAAFAAQDKNHIITTQIEHDCVLNACRWLETQGFTVTYLPVDSEGFVDPVAVEKAITPKTIIVSVIHGNNEIGTIQDIDAIGAICKKKGVLFHIDACQSYTKVEINVKKTPVDLITINSHKIHGPKGVGALYMRSGVKLVPLMHGGGHERGKRSGTENVSGIVGFAKAAKIAKLSHAKDMAKLRDYIITGIQEIPDVELNGPEGDKRLCNNINFVFHGAEGESIGAYLDSKGICSSTGSACSAHTLEPSHVLRALGRSTEEALSALRLTISRFTTKKEADYLLQALPGIIEKLRKGRKQGKNPSKKHVADDGW